MLTTCTCTFYVNVLCVFIILIFCRTLKNCVKHCGGKERVCQLWKGCGLKWAKLGVSEGDLEGFLKDKVREY